MNTRKIKRKPSEGKKNFNGEKTGSSPTEMAELLIATYAKWKNRGRQDHSTLHVKETKPPNFSLKFANNIPPHNLIFNIIHNPCQGQSIITHKDPKRVSRFRVQINKLGKFMIPGGDS